MNAIRAMGYIAVGVGKSEFAIEIDKVLGSTPVETAAALFLGWETPTERAPNSGSRFRRGEPAPHRRRRWAQVGQVSVGVVGVVGKSVAGEVEQA